MSITDTNIYTTTWKAIKDILVAANIQAERDDGNTKNASVKPAFVNDRTAMPLLVVQEVAKPSEADYKFGSNEGKKTLAVTVDCYTITSKGVEQLGEQVESAIKTALGNGTLIGIDLIDISSDNSFVDPNFGSYKNKSITFTFLRE